MSELNRKYQSPLGKARGLGSAHEGVHTWLHERVSAVLLVPLVLWLVWSMINLRGVSYWEFTQWMSQPWNSSLMIFLILTAFYHAAMGLQVVIEDYVASHSRKLIKIILVKLAFAFMAVACVFSVLKIAL